MIDLSKLDSKLVWENFQQICSIPHPSKSVFGNRIPDDRQNNKLFCAFERFYFADRSAGGGAVYPERGAIMHRFSSGRTEFALEKAGQKGYNPNKSWVGIAHYGKGRPLPSSGTARRCFSANNK